MKTARWTLALWLVVVAQAATKRKTTRGKMVVPKKQKKKTTSLLSSFLGMEETLYSTVPDVIEYEGDEDTDFKESKLPRVVQFYSPQCVSWTGPWPSSQSAIVVDINQALPTLRFGHSCEILIFILHTDALRQIQAFLH